MRFLGKFLIWALGLGALGMGGLVLLAALMPEPPSADAQWQTLDPAERAAVEALLKPAGLGTEAVRPIFDASGRLYEHPANRLSIVIEDGHVTGLSLQEIGLSEVPDALGTLTRLRSLSLAGNRLTAWPDLSRLGALAYLDLSRNPALQSPVAERLPAALETLRLGETQVTELAPLAGLGALRTLELSGTPVTSFDALLPLALDTLDLRDTAVARLPDALPTAGAWAVDLAGAPAIRPAGHTADWPFDGLVRGASQDADLPRGSIDADRLDMGGTIAQQSATLSYTLPESRQRVDGNVVLEATLTRGRARLWLMEPSGLFESPWLTRGLVAGFGALRQPGHVHVVLDAGQSVTLTGRLHHSVRDGIYDLPVEQRKSPSRATSWHRYTFYVEPMDGPIEGLQYRIRRTND